MTTPDRIHFSSASALRKRLTDLAEPIAPAVQPRPLADPRFQDITDRIRELGEYCQGFIPTKLPIEPHHEQVRMVIGDLESLCRKVDPVVEAMAAYVQHTTGYR